MFYCISTVKESFFGHSGLVSDARPFVDSEVEEAGFRMSSGLKQRLRNKLIISIADQELS